MLYMYVDVLFFTLLFQTNFMSVNLNIIMIMYL